LKYLYETFSRMRCMASISIAGSVVVRTLLHAVG